MVPREIQQNLPKLLGNHRIAKTKAVTEKILKLLLLPISSPLPSLPLPYKDEIRTGILPNY